MVNYEHRGGASAEVDPSVNLQWRQEAACVDHVDLFALTFDAKGVASPPEVLEAVEEAKRICRVECPVREECLEYAVSQHQDFGIWGGLNITDRRRLRKRAREAAANAS